MTAALLALSLCGPYSDGEWTGSLARKRWERAHTESVAEYVADKFKRLAADGRETHQTPETLAAFIRLNGFDPEPWNQRVALNEKLAAEAKRTRLIADGANARYQICDWYQGDVTKLSDAQAIRLYHGWLDALPDTDVNEGPDD
jgi:hypothetical protein